MKIDIFLPMEKERPPMTDEWYQNNAEEWVKATWDHDEPRKIGTHVEAEVPIKTFLAQMRFFRGSTEEYYTTSVDIPLPKEKKKILKWRWECRSPFGVEASTIGLHTDEEIIDSGMSHWKKIIGTETEVEE